MISLDDHTVVAENETDLRNAVSSKKIDYVYLKNDITLTDGMTIYHGKETLVIDGEYPAGTIHTFTDMKSIDSGDTLGVRVGSSIKITIRNMIINGRNYYGVPYIIDDTATSNVSITYEKVKYTGRQMTYNRYGTTKYIDCDITNTPIGTWTAHEIGEVCKVEIGGETTILKDNDTNAVFWFCGEVGSCYFKILADAKVKITTSHYFMYVRYVADAIPYIIEPGASFKLSTNTGISYANDHRVESFLVEKNASFEYIQTTRGIGASLSIKDTLAVKEGARFFMRADYTASSPLITFPTSGTIQNLNIEKPKSFVLYKRNTPAITFAQTRPFLLSGGQVNFWQEAALFPTAGTFDNIPLYSWHNQDWSGFEIKGDAGTSKTTITSDTLTPPVEPALSNLQLHLAQVLSVGDLPLTVDPVLINQRPITGRSDSSANIRVEYTDQSGAHLLTQIADENGYFSIETLAPIPLGTAIKVSGNVPFLYGMYTKTAQEVGELFIREAPEGIRFVTPPISKLPIVLGRSANDPVVVVDTRAYRTEWELMVSIDRTMQTEAGHKLPEAVVFLPVQSAYDRMEPLSTEFSERVFVGGPKKDVTEVTWNDKMGILLHVKQPLHYNEKYSTDLIWTVRPLE